MYVNINSGVQYVQTDSRYKQYVQQKSHHRCKCMIPVNEVFYTGLISHNGPGGVECDVTKHLLMNIET